MPGVRARIGRLVLAALLLQAAPALLAAGLEERIEFARHQQEALRVQLRDVPGQLMVSLPDKSTQPLGGGYCQAPLLVQLEPAIRAASLCGLGSQVAWVLWEWQGGQWGNGVMLGLRRSGWNSDAHPTANWKALSFDPLLRAVSRSSRQEVQVLDALWQRLAQESLPDPAQFLAGAPEVWPKGLLAIHRDGRLLLAGSSLSGLAKWQQWLETRQWPAAVQGLAGARVVDEQGRQLVLPGMLLDSLELGGKSYSVALIASSPKLQDVIWRDANKQVQLLPLAKP